MTHLNPSFFEARQRMETSRTLGPVGPVGSLKWLLDEARGIDINSHSPTPVILSDSQWFPIPPIPFLGESGGLLQNKSAQLKGKG